MSEFYVDLCENREGQVFDAVMNECYGDCNCYCQCDCHRECCYTNPGCM